MVEVEVGLVALSLRLNMKAMVPNTETVEVDHPSVGLEATRGLAFQEIGWEDQDDGSIAIVVKLEVKTIKSEAIGVKSKTQAIESETKEIGLEA